MALYGAQGKPGVEEMGFLDYVVVLRLASTRKS